MPTVVSDFEAPVVVVRQPANSDPDLLPFSIALGQETEVKPDELAATATTLIVGRPGSGKTELLRKAASEIPTADRAVYVRLAGIGGLIGESVETLARWARDAQTSQPTRSLTVDDLNRQRFHFLMDGLDEVPASRQALLAERIASMARALPQHRFIVTSRNVAATEILTSAGWRQLELVATSDWRDRYLARAGLTARQLFREAPALHSLGDLLNLPFFMHVVVELHADGRLPLDGDAMSLAVAFIERALATDELTEIAPAVRPWLADVALTMQLTGRPQLNVSELKEVPLPAGLDLGPEDEVLARLTDRSLLEHTGKGVRFGHRLLGDTLAAEKLISLGPGRSGLLDLIAPRTSMSSGLRNEWLTIMSFVGSRDESWRRALGERSRLAGARVTPPDASVDERRAALLLLWGLYTELRVWMDAGATQSLTKDAETIGSLLQVGDLDDVLDEILGGIHSDSPQTRSNALDVIAKAKLDDVLLTLVRVTLSGDRDEVVRRQAAAAASSRHLIDAFPLVRKRALEADHLEAQVMVSVGGQLASDDQLLDFAIAVERSGTSQHWSLEHAVRDRLGAGAALKVLRARFEYGSHSVFGGIILRDVMADLPDDEDAAEDLGFIAAMGGDDAILTSVLAQHPASALAGLQAGYDHTPRQRWRVVRLIIDIAGTDLDSTTISNEHLRNDVETLLAAWRQRAEEDEEPRGESAAPEEQAEELADEPPTLTTLLGRPDEEAEQLLLRGAFYLQQQVPSLSKDDKAELAWRIDDWWPEQGLESGTTKANGERRMSWEVHACLVYGGQLRPPLSSERWTQVATVSAFFTGQEEWLRDQYQRSAISKVADTLDDNGTMAWARIVQTIPTKVPVRVANAIAEKVTTDDGAGHELVERLWQDGRLPAVRKLAKLPGSLGHEATCVLARAGDVNAQRRCLRQLITDLGTAKSIHAHDLQWMEGIVDARLLDDLFEALVASFNCTLAANDFNDTMEPIHLAIRRIGGAEALQRYDELLAHDPPPFDGAQFEVLQREATSQDLLKAAGDERLNEVCAELGLPLLEFAPA